MNVSIVLVSHSPKIAEGVCEMIKQMVGNEVDVAYCGGNPDGDLGTDVAAIKSSIEKVWNEAGTIVFVDLGGAEMNAEMAIELLSAEMQSKVLLSNAPIVEGAVMAATEASVGGDLQEVNAAAVEVL